MAKVIEFPTGKLLANLPTESLVPSHRPKAFMLSILDPMNKRKFLVIAWNEIKAREIFDAICAVKEGVA